MEHGAPAWIPWTPAAEGTGVLTLELALKQKHSRTAGKELKPGVALSSAVDQRAGLDRGQPPRLTRGLETGQWPLPLLYSRRRSLNRDASMSALGRTLQSF